MRHFIVLILFLIIGFSSFSNEVTSKSFSRHDFTNVILEQQENKALLKWNLDYNAYQVAQEKDAHIILRYKTTSSTSWHYLDTLSIGTNRYELQLPTSKEAYLLQVGILTEKEAIYHEAITYQSYHSWGIMQWLKLIGAMGLLIYGMKTLSDSTQQLSGSRLRNIMESLTSNPLKSLLTGLGITALIQASAVTVIMTSSFTSAGLITLKQAAGVIMGANIGTTVKGWLISLVGWDMNFTQYALIMFAFSVPFLFISKINLKPIGSLLIGLALLILGLDFIKNSVPDVTTETPWVQFFIGYQDIPFVSTVLFVALGMIITFFVQSSSAALILTMALISNGVLSFEMGVAMILGENIGTTFTSEIAAMIGNVNAKRAVRIHTLFNVIGVIWAIIALPVLIDIVAYTMDYVGWGNPVQEAAESGAIGLAFFHSLFNVVNSLLLIGFIPQLKDLAQKTIRSKHNKKQTELQFIGAGLVSNPALSFSEAKTYILKIAHTTLHMSHLASQLVTEKDVEIQKNKLKQLQKLEDQSDNQEQSILRYLNSISEGELTPHTAKQIHILSVVAHDFERIGDTYERIGKALQRKQEDKIWINPNQRSNILSLFNEVNKGFELLIENLQSDDVDVQEAIKIEESINSLRNRFRKEYFKTLDDSDHNIKGGLLYSDLFTSLEKIGDHIIKITYHAKDLN